jgi:ribosomal protein S18 acetylase RimI-like enzyme
MIMKTPVKTFYLELPEDEALIPKEGFRKRIEVREIANDAFPGFMLFAGVGLPWRWYSRLGWTTTEWDEYYASHEVRTWLGFEGKNLIGYYEIVFGENSAEIKFFGLFPGYMGGGLGGMLLSHAVESARVNGAKRVWLHTCTNDSEAALGNYLARGFRVFREEEAVEDVPGTAELLRLSAQFMASYVKRFNFLLPSKPK